MRQDKKIIDEKFGLIFKHLLEIEDVDLCEELLKIRRATEIDKETMIKEKEKYMKYIKDFSKCEYTWKSEQIMGYGKQVRDILDLIKLCGKLDARLSDSDDMIYYSDKTKDVIVLAAIGAYGKICDYIWFDGEFGHYESDRARLMYHHDEAYKEEKKLLKAKEQERSL